MIFTKNELIVLLGNFLEKKVFRALYDYCAWGNDNSEMEEDKLVFLTRTSVLHFLDDDIKYRTSFSELYYLYNCLVGKELFSQNKFDKISLLEVDLSRNEEYLKNK
jgi:hypothetical protein